MIERIREFRRRWFEPTMVSGHGIFWLLEDGRVLTQDEFLDECTIRGGDGWFFRERTHWQAVWEDGQRVSTVWLGLDHSFSIDGGPRPARVWETCVFGPYDTGSGVTMRYLTRWDAWKGHWKMVWTVIYYRAKAALRREPRLKLEAKEDHD